MTLAPGDIIAVRGDGWLSNGIAAAEYPKGEPAQSATHVGLLVAGDPIPVVIEALSEVRTNPLEVTVANVQKAYVLHDQSLTDVQRKIIVATACSFSADDYGWLDLFAQELDARLRSFWFTNHLAWYLKHFPICSYVVAAAYGQVKLDFGVATASCKPSDVLGYALSHPAIYTVTQVKP